MSDPRSSWVEVMGTGAGGVLLGAVLNRFFDWLNQRGMSAAKVQEIANASISLALQESHAAHNACRDELAVVRGNLRNAEQYIQSLANWLRREGLDVPKFKVEPIFVLGSSETKDNIDG